MTNLDPLLKGQLHSSDVNQDLFLFWFRLEEHREPRNECGSQNWAGEHLLEFEQGIFCSIFSALTHSATLPNMNQTP